MTFACSPIPAYMNSKNCTQEYLFLPTESSFGPPASTASNLASIPPQGMSVLDGRWSGTRSFDIPDRQVDAEASLLVCCGTLSYLLIPMFRNTPLVSVHHHILLFFPSAQRARYTSLKLPSLPVISTTRAHRTHHLRVFRKRTLRASQ